MTARFLIEVVPQPTRPWHTAPRKPFAVTHNNVTVSEHDTREEASAAAEDLWTRLEQS